MITTSKEAKIRNVINRSRQVIQCDLDGNELNVYPSAVVAAEMLGIKIYQNIHSVCKGQKKTCHGFKWKYKGSKNELSINNKIADDRNGRYYSEEESKRITIKFSKY